MGTETDPVSETLWFLGFRVPDDGQSPEIQWFWVQRICTEPLKAHTVPFTITELYFAYSIFVCSVWMSGETSITSLIEMIMVSVTDMRSFGTDLLNVRDFRLKGFKYICTLLLELCLLMAWLKYFCKSVYFRNEWLTANRSSFCAQITVTIVKHAQNESCARFKKGHFPVGNLMFSTRRRKINSVTKK
jgi:hypothetical protein